jgi:hypothetical protein
MEGQEHCEPLEHAPLHTMHGKLQDSTAVEAQLLLHDLSDEIQTLLSRQNLQSARFVHANESNNAHAPSDAHDVTAPVQEKTPSTQPPS